MGIAFRDLYDQANKILSSMPCDPLSRGSRIALFGTGFLGQWALRWLRESGASVIACYDSDPQKIGTTCEGIIIESATAISETTLDFVFITARHAVAEVHNRLNALGVYSLSLDAFCVARDLAALERVHDLLDDERSRMTLRNVLMTMMTGDVRFCSDVFEPNQYFCLHPFCGSAKEVYVDAGAYVGDSIERFLWAQNGVFSKIYAFEPGSRQFTALKARTERLMTEWAIEPTSVELLKAGLGSRPGMTREATANQQLQSTSLSSTAEGNVPVLQLDAILQGQRVSFIKADVEGMERELITGAEESIKRWKPKLAICVYHYPIDILSIFNQLNELVQDYSFSIRHHSPAFMETVLYCWVK